MDEAVEMEIVVVVEEVLVAVGEIWNYLSALSTVTPVEAFEGAILEVVVVIFAVAVVGTLVDVAVEAFEALRALESSSK